MMTKKNSISDYTEAEFIAFVRKLFNVENTTEEEDIATLLEFKRLSEHPSGSDLIYYPNKNRPDTPEGVVQEVKEWRAQQGKPGFKVG
ncbi:bacteriocin immunity protein [Providencia stuartii]|uniref:Bacteriocin immunity protein n=1 Tax=Providencia stuartii TaxID=588 RepID=A0AAI9GFB2_PROST|nr:MULTISPECIES: bacteriocin immunity protein [Providencia]MDV5224507.1 bacteriocin immunity protein [Providencia rettgeri]ELR5041614.1 bacteriocin immunity protein [Providencia stuartii]ELR5080338.1 bacteriocin immunity protein [Providencia stuartii]ELR5084588.1 bacteriocin immunity protein [Providencia stuartii]ELR5111342.1 bacteriocin immunity protein [Providencia stuartii]